MVNAHVFIATEHKSVIAYELIRAGNAAPAYHLDRMIQQLFSADVGNRSYLNDSIALQNANLKFQTHALNKDNSTY
jgi:hypothetical protein